MSKEFNIHDWQDKQRRLNERSKASPAVINKLTTIYHKIKGWLAGGKVDLNDPLAQQLGLGVDIAEQDNFDSRLAQAMGMSDDEFEDQVASRDIGSPFPGTDNVSQGNKKASDLIDKLRKEYRSMSDEDLDEFSKEMLLHFIDNTAAQAAAKIYFGKKGI